MLTRSGFMWLSAAKAATTPVYSRGTSVEGGCPSIAAKRLNEQFLDHARPPDI